MLRELASPTILGLIVFTFILLSTHLFRLIDLLVNRGVPLPMFGALIGTLLPPLLILTIPMALLVGVLLGVGRLAADNEIMAMRTSGVHLGHVFVPVGLAALILAGGVFYANRSFVPRLIHANESLIEQIKFIVATSLEAERTFAPEGDREVGLYFGKRNLLTGRMERMSLKVEVSNPQRASDKSFLYAAAREGYIDADPFEGFMDVVLIDGTLHHLDDLTTTTNFRNVVSKFGELTWRLELEKEEQISKGPSGYTSTEIINKLQNEELGRDQSGALKTELYQRRSIPLACLAFVLLGIPMAIRVRPTGKAIAFSIAFGLIFFYYVMLKWGASLSQDGSPLGAIIIFLPNLIIGGLGLLLFYRILRQ